MKTATKNAWAAVVESLRVEPVRADEITTTQLASETGRSHEASRRFLIGEVRAGRAVRRKLVIDGKQVNVYRRLAKTK